MEEMLEVRNCLSPEWSCPMGEDLLQDIIITGKYVLQLTNRKAVL